MKEDLKQFVMEVFDGDRADATEFVDTTSRTFNITKMLKDGRLEERAVFHNVWRSVFHTLPSFGVANMYFSQNDAVAHTSVHAFLSHVVPHFRFLGVSAEQLATMIKEKRTMVSGNPDLVKQFVAEKLCKRFGVDTQECSNLYNMYKELKTGCPTRFETFLADNHLSSNVDGAWVNILTRRKLPSSAPSLPTTTSFDAVVNTAVMDSHLFLTVAGAVLVDVRDVNVPKTTLEYVIDAVSNLGSKVVLISAPDQHMVRTKNVNIFCFHQMVGKSLALSDLVPPVATAHVVIDTEAPKVVFSKNAGNLIHLKPAELPSVVPESCVRSVAFLEKWLHNKIAKKSPEIDFVLNLHNLIPKAIDGAIGADVSAAKHAVVFLDNRPNITNVIAAKITLANLRRGEWAVVGFVHEEDVGFYRKWLGDTAMLITDAAFVLSKKSFSLEFYNAVLMNPVMWERLSRFERVLLVQDDGFLIKPGMEDAFLEYDYVGAPWSKDMPYNSYLVKGAEGTLVGNGGLSLRDPTKMKEICESEDTSLLHFDRLQVEPEDVFFAKACVRRGFKVPTYEVAQRFSTEQVLCMGSFGFHKMWGYHPQPAVEAFFGQALAHVKDVVREQYDHE